MTFEPSTAGRVDLLAFKALQKFGEKEPLVKQALGLFGDQVAGMLEYHLGPGTKAGRIGQHIAAVAREF